MTVARAWILFATVATAAAGAAATLSGYELPRALLAAGAVLLGVLAASAIARARRASDSVLPARSELATLAFPPSTPAERGRRG